LVIGLGGKLDWKG